jgi:hypothetical protein
MTNYKKRVSGRYLAIEKEVSGPFVLGKVGTEYGLWVEIDTNNADYAPNPPDYKLVLKNPDSILVTDQYLYFSNSKKFGLVYRNVAGDSIQDIRKDIYVTKDKQKIDSLILKRKRLPTSN